MIGGLAFNVHFHAAQMGEFLDTLFNREVQGLPTCPKLHDNVIRQHHHQGMRSGALFQADIDRDTVAWLLRWG